MVRLEDADDRAGTEDNELVDEVGTTCVENATGSGGVAVGVEMG